ncbi:MAG TPA: hypothetical protein VHE35_20215, partial [Kofleriaceae bacterium]|nr:hypothetical protein [Kofleriaceae bacterium]
MAARPPVVPAAVGPADGAVDVEVAPPPGDGDQPWVDGQGPGGDGRHGGGGGGGYHGGGGGG